jgi:hypothetical protein
MGGLSAESESVTISEEIITGINNINLNGNVSDNGTFNLQGCRVVQTNKGIYIINKRKILVK